MTSKTPLRSCEDVDESVLSYAEVKALCIGDPRIKEKMELDIDVSKLRLLESSFKNQHYTIQYKLRKRFPALIAQTEQKIALLELDAAASRGISKLIILGKTFIWNDYTTEQRTEAAKALSAAASTFGRDEGTIGEYRGFKIGFYFDSFYQKVYLKLTGATTHNVELGNSASGNLTRLENEVNAIPNRLEVAKRQFENLHTQVKTAEEELKRPFP